MKYLMKYPFLEAIIKYRHVTKTGIASAWGISDQALYNKLAGYTRIYWDEVCILQKRFFPEIDKDTLMMETDDFPEPYRTMFEEAQRSEHHAYKSSP